MSGMNRRQFMAAMLAGGVLTASGLWMPGEKTISIPSHKYFVPKGALGWFNDGQAFIMRGGKGVMVPEYFDVDIRGAELAHAIREE